MTRTLRFTAAGTVLAMMFVCGHEASADTPSKPKRQVPFTALRSTDRDLMGIVDQGLVRSATLRRLEDRLRQARVIVYLAPGHESSTRGRTRLIGTGDGWRYLLIDLDTRLPKIDLLALLGHELQHAVEIAEAADVVDESTLVALYQRIGLSQREGSSSIAFETRHAIETGQQVFAELMGMNW